MRLLSRLRGAALARVIVAPALVSEAPLASVSGPLAPILIAEPADCTAPLRLSAPVLLVRMIGPVAPTPLRLRSPLRWVMFTLLKPVPKRPLPLSL